MLTKDGKKEIDFNVVTSDGKYEYQFYKDGTSCILRYYEYWKDTTGDKLVYSLAHDLYNLKNKSNI